MSEYLNKLRYSNKIVITMLVLVLIILIPVSCTRPTEEPAATRTPTPQLTKPAPTVTPFSPRTITPSPSPVVTEEAAEGQFYVSPDGRDTGDGSFENPWSLQTALDHPDEVQPGDTIWLRGGTYKGEFVSWLKGEKGNPIIVRQYPGERAILDAIDERNKVLWIADSHWTYFWGFEVMASENTRPIKDGPGDGGGIVVHGRYQSSNIKLINLIVHDIPAQGIAFWRANRDSEIYGSLIFNNGVNQYDHGIYTQNIDGLKYLTDNIIFNNANYGIHAYGSASSYLNNFVLEGNTVFNNGSIGFNINHKTYGDMGTNILVGGEVIARNPVLIENYTYFPGTSGSNVNVGYHAGSEDAVLRDNYFAGGNFVLGGEAVNIAMSGNEMIGTPAEGLAFAGIQLGSLFIQRPDNIEIFVRPNLYEPGRANITIYNWKKFNTVEIDAEMLKDVAIQKGDRYVCIMCRIISKM
jgi:hypothetical protein